MIIRAIPSKIESLRDLIGPTMTPRVEVEKGAVITPCEPTFALRLVLPRKAQRETRRDDWRIGEGIRFS